MGSLFQTVPIIAHGYGAFEELGVQVAALGGRALVVTGRRAMREQGFVDRALAQCAAAGVEADVHEGVPPEPTVANVDEVRAHALDHRAEVLVGLGGGSALDVAKATAGLLLESEPTAAFLHGAPLSGARASFVGVPSTFGTGTEATPNAVLIDPDAGVKKSIRHPSLLARVAVVDPELGLAAPPKVKAESGMDAFTQAIEGFYSRHSTSITESLSFGAAALLAADLEAFVCGEPGALRSAAENVATASLMAGQAFANARLGVVHGLVHPLGVRTGLPHGRLCGILLPYALRYNRDAAPEPYALLCGIVKRDIADFCQDLLKALGLPTDLADLGLTRDDLAAIAREALPSGSTRANPRAATPGDLEALLATACGLPETA
ncbi:MAG: iron-containing alcohol dehydrogenase family protein [Planctomycetota bacterium]